MVQDAAKGDFVAGLLGCTSSRRDYTKHETAVPQVDLVQYWFRVYSASLLTLNSLAGVGSQCTPAPAPALTPAPSPTLSQASPAGTLFAPSSTVQYGLLILIIVCVVGILVGPVIICALRRYRRIAPAELERIRQVRERR
jgi:hypothetical protein